MNLSFYIFQIFTVQLDLFLLLDITLRAFGFLFAYPEASAIWYWHQVVGRGLHILLKKDACIICGITHVIM